MNRTLLAALKCRASCAALALLVGLSQTVAAVSLFDVIEMTRNGYSEVEITKLMEVTGARFEIDALGLMTLNDAGVEDSVISRMLDDGGVAPNQTSQIAADQMVTLRESGFSEEMILKFVRHRNVCIPQPADGIRRLQQAGFSQEFMLGLSGRVEACRATRVARAPIEPLPEGSYSTRREPQIYQRYDPFFDSYYYGRAVYPVYIYVDHRKRHRGGGHDDGLDNMEDAAAPIGRQVGDESRQRAWARGASTKRRAPGGARRSHHGVDPATPASTIEPRAAYSVTRTATYSRPGHQSGPRHHQTGSRYQSAPSAVRAPSRAAIPRSAPSVHRSMPPASRLRPSMPSHAPSAVSSHRAGHGH